MVNKIKKDTNKSVKLGLEEVGKEIQSLQKDLTKQDIKAVLNAFGVVLLSQLKKGNNISFKGLFTFSTRKSEEKTMTVQFGKDKGKEKKYPAKMVPVCKFGGVIKEGLKSVKVK